MKKLCMMLVFCMALYALPAYAIQGYVFDLADTESTRFSSGTGGTVWRGGADITHVGTTCEGDYDAHMLTDEMLAVVHAWQDEVNDLWKPDEPRDVRIYLVTGGDTTLLQLVAQDYGESETVDNAYTRYYQTLLMDVNTGKQLQLSDLFYDRFNYIAYINQCIAASNENEQVYEYSGAEPPVQRLARRPFTGIPADYPFFSLWRNDIELYLDSDNPFWPEYNRGYYPIEVHIPLNHHISPYGDCAVDHILYETILLKGENAMLCVPTSLRVDGGASPASEAGIIAKMPDMVAEILRLAGDVEYEKKALLSPDIWGSEKHVGVAFELEIGDRYAERTLEVDFFFGYFDCETGAHLGLQDELSHWLSHPAVAYYQAAPFNTDVTERPPLRDYQPPEGTVVTCRETIYGWCYTDNTYWLHLQEPSGAYVDMLLPKEDAQAAYHPSFD